MLDVRIFDGSGNLKKEISHKEVIAMGNKESEKKKRGAAYSGLYRRKSKKNKPAKKL